MVRPRRTDAELHVVALMGHCLRAARIGRASLGVALAVAALASSVAGSAAADDVVFTKDGGRARGTVVEETNDGVRIQLVDGTIKTFSKSAVDHVQYGDAASPAAATAAPAPVPAPTPAPATTAPVASAPVVVAPAGNGTLHITSTTPGTVMVDGDERGRTPLDVTIEPGSHVVKVRFDGSGRATKRVHVTPGETTNLELRKSTAATVADARSGPHLSVGAEIGWMHTTGSQGLDASGAGVRLTPGVTLGLGTFVDLRADLVLALGFVGDETGSDPPRDPGLPDARIGRVPMGPAWALGPDVQAHFNFGAVYTPWLGTGIAYFHPGCAIVDVTRDFSTGSKSKTVTPFDNTWALLFEGSPAWFRFGPAAQYELGVIGNLYWIDQHHQLMFGVSAGFTYVFAGL